jgi:DNA-binding CsgD family transcriptional regulator
MALIGRQHELAVLGEALEAAAGGRTARLLIEGSLGSGATRLLDELQGRLTDLPGVIVCRARAFAPQSGVAYAALATALGRVLAGLPDDRLKDVVAESSGDLVRLLPGLAARIAALAPAAEPGPQAPDQLGAHVLESLLGVLERLATTAPGGNGVVCLVLEDLEHVDPGTGEFVEALLRVSRRLPLALLLSYHPDEIQRGHRAWEFLRRLRDNPGVETLPIRPLSRDELFALIEDLEGSAPSLSLGAAIMEGSRGNPLVATQLVAAQQQLEGLRLSDPLAELIQARLDALAPEVVRVLRLLAGGGRPGAAAERLRRALPDGHVTRPALAAAIESGLAVVGVDGLAIVHELCAEPIAAQALAPERQALHAALAQLLDVAPAERAWHSEQALARQSARRAHLAAAEAALTIEPGQTALDHYQRAIELSDSAELADGALLAAAAAAAAAAGAFRRAATLVEQAIERRAGGRLERLLASDQVVDRVAVGELSGRLGEYRRAAGDPVGGRRALEAAAALVPTDAGAPRALALAELAQQLMLDGEFERSAQLAEQARAAARGAQPAATFELGHATCTLGVDLGWLGQIDRGLSLLEEATELARQAGRLDEMMRSYANRTTLLDLDSRRPAALTVVKRGLAEATRGGLGMTYGAFLRGNAADILFQLGRWTEAEVECRAALEFPPAGLAWFSPILYLGLVLVESRADEESARLVGQTVLQLETVPAGQWSALVQRSAVSLALWRGDAGDARRAAETHWPRVVATGDEAQIAASASTVLEACAAAAEQGRERREWSLVADAGELAGQVLPAAEKALAGSALPASLGARREAELHLATARAHEARLRGRASVDEWAELARRWAEVPIPYHVAKARWWQATAALEARAARSIAREALEEAWRIAAELPARPLQQALLELAARGRVPLADESGRVAIPIEPSVLVAVGPGPIAAATDDGPRAPAATSTTTGRAIAERLTVEGGPISPARFGLSPRESEVLLVLAEGRTNREIAERLFISERTVAVHVRRILAKLGVAGRVEATGLAIRLGLVPDDPSISRYLIAAGRR